jgi:3-hydroxybutyryl-CoA dehydratase
MMLGKTYDQMAVGDSATFSKTITETDITLFGAISGDFNPAHMDAEYAATTKFEKRIAHGMIATSLISGLLGMKLPGAGTIYLDQYVKFTAPVYIGDTITAKVEVAEKLARNRVKMITTVSNQNGVSVLEGEANILAPRAPKL